VQADPEKLYSYALFQQNFTGAVTLPGGGPAGGTVAGLQQLITQHAATLAASAELNAAGSAIDAVAASSESPASSDPVWIAATVGANGNPVSGVGLYYRADPTAPYQRVAMLDDGVYGALLPVSAGPGQSVAYYVEAIAQNAYQSHSYRPAPAERGPQSLTYGYGVAEDSPMRVTESMYSSGGGGEFVEFTNVSDTVVDMARWSMDDSNALAGAFDLSAFGSAQPGE